MHNISLPFENAQRLTLIEALNLSLLSHGWARGYCLVVPDNHELLMITTGVDAMDELRVLAYGVLAEEFGAQNVIVPMAERGLLVRLTDTDRRRAEVRVQRTLRILPQRRIERHGESLGLTARAGVVWLDGDSECHSVPVLHRKLLSAAVLARDPWASRFLQAGRQLQGGADIELTARLLCDLPAALTEQRIILTAQEIAPAQPLSSDRRQYEVMLYMRDRAGVEHTPGHFLIAAEDSALIEMVDHWVLHEVLVCNSAALNANPNIHLSLNVAARTLSSRRFVPLLVDLLETGGLDATRIQLEITETAIIRDMTQAQENVAGAKKLGFRIALDDFGAGQSGFAYLKAFAPDCIKIDGSLIGDVLDPHAMDAPIVRSILGLARDLKLEVVAEHVSSAELRAQLCEMGVHKLQGFEIGRPQLLSSLFCKP